MRFIIALFTFILMMSPAYSKTLTILLLNASTQPGINAKLVGKYMQKHMPEVTDVEIKVLPGAGGLNVANYLYNVAEKDGFTMASIPRAIPFKSFLGEPNAKFDATKFTWLGSTSDGREDVNILMSNRDYYDGLIIGDYNTGKSSIVEFITSTTNLRLNRISGYVDQPAVRLSYQRKEVDGFFASLSGYQLNKYEGNIILQYGSGLVRSFNLPNVPTAMEIAKDNDSRYLISILELSNVLTRPFIAPPDIPVEMASKLRRAFTQAVRDPDYKIEAEKINIVVDLVDWRQSENIIKQLSKIDKEILLKISD